MGNSFKLLASHHNFRFTGEHDVPPSEVPHPGVPHTSDATGFLIAIEAAFDVEIADADAERMNTVGDLHAHLSRQLAERITPYADEVPGTCLCHTMFHQTRRALREQFGVERIQIRPTAATATLIPAQNRRARWQQLATAMEVTLPSLQRPLWLQNALGWLFAALFFGCLAAFLRGGIAGCMTTVGAICLFGAACAATIPLATRIPPACETLRGTVETLTRLQYVRLAREMGVWNPHEVWLLLRSLIAREVGCEATEITPQTRLVEDIRLG